ncbi:hypothetical protein J4441_03165, partial [Candidatus Micrarchaeota archaeon]|nr:hypothetical protein [Candidatus Micrarchaeota archaeon]
MIKAANKDPLESLFVIGDEVNRELLRDILEQYVRLDERGNIYPLSSFYEQANKNKIIIVLLARKALALRIGTSEAISPTELHRYIEIPGGSLNPTLRWLAENGIADDDGSKYRIWPQAVQRCSELLKRKEENGIAGRNESEKNISMSIGEALKDIIRQGGLDEGKTHREIYEMIARRRPKTTINASYNVIMSFVKED